MKNRKVVGYIRVSTVLQDTEKNKADILTFANDRKFVPVTFVEEKVSGRKNWKERKLGSVVESLSEGDCLIVPELSRFSRSLREILEIIEILKRKNVNVYALKGNWELNGSINSKVLLTMLALVSEIERDLISERTREALAARKASGKPLGRPRGPGKSKLDQYREEIQLLLRNGSRQNYIAAKYGTTAGNLTNWIKKNKISTLAIV